jgi:hypothetical protein
MFRPLTRHHDPIVRGPQADVDSWNANVAVGGKVTYRRDNGAEIQTRTRSRAQVLSNHTAVVWLDGITGCVALDRVMSAVS